MQPPPQMPLLREQKPNFFITVQVLYLHFFLFSPLVFSSRTFYAPRCMYFHPLVDTVLKNIKPIVRIASCHFLLACSGGADSTALLLVFRQLQQQLSCKVSVITVNHNIRSAAESAGDSAFVAELCNRFDPPIPCVVAEIPTGDVARCAKKRCRGTEDAARTLRYRLFEKTADSVSADFIVTAHNRSDVYETVLMRLFQGGSTATLSAMPMRRGRYLRPLITVERSSIEEFLRQQGIVWREDATNAHDTYLRNRIRHYLVPTLTATFGGWQAGLDKTLQRIAVDRSFCEEALTDVRVDFTGAAGPTDWEQCKHGAITIPAVFFDSLHPALRIRLLEQGCHRLRIGERVPLGILMRLSVECALKPKASKTQGIATGSVSSAALEASSAPEIVAMSREEQTDTHSQVAAAGVLRLERRGSRILLFDNTAYRKLYAQKSYFLTIIQCGMYAYPLGQLEVYRTSAGVFIRDTEDKSTGIGPVVLPLSVRARRSGDRIQMSSGKLKEIKKILNEWRVDSLARELLPIIIEDSCVPKRIRAVYGSLLGYKNWFVEE